MRKLIMCLIVCASAGCAVTQAPTTMTEEEILEQETELTTGIPAADQLLKQGEQLRSDGDYAGAANAFERGIRMAPRSASLYLALAKTRLAMGDAHNAQQMAQRALSLLPAQPKGAERTAKAEAWMLIAEARDALGDNTGAEMARKNAQQTW